jgi:hypothetical protein
MYMMFVPDRKHTMVSTTCYWDSFTLLHVDDVRISRLLRPFKGDSFTFFLYINDVCTSQKTHTWTCTACYGDGFTYIYFLQEQILLLVFKLFLDII